MNARESKVLLYSLIASLGGLLFGFDIAIFSGTIPFIVPHFNLEPDQLGWVASCLYVGCIFGAMAFGRIAQRLGRKPSLILVSLIFIVSSIFMGIADTIDSIIFWRIVAGFSVGGASILSPLYIAEISPQKIRGKMVSLNQMAIVIGILLAYLSNYFLSGIEGNWRWMFISGAVPATAFLIASFFFPESPKWLIYKGRLAEGKRILENTVDEKELVNELEYLQSQNTKGKDSIGAIYRSIFQKPHSFLLLIAIVIAVFQQISGANAVLFYAPIIFEKVGMDVENQLLIQILIGSVNLLFTLVAIRTVDKVGRKKLMMIGAGTMAILLLLIGLSFQGDFIPQKFVSVLVLLFIGTYAATLAPVTWVIIAEIFPLRIREQAMSIASAFLWVACFGITYVFPVMIATLTTFQTFTIFGGLCAIYFLFLWLYVPETKNNRV